MAVCLEVVQPNFIWILCAVCFIVLSILSFVIVTRSLLNPGKESKHERIIGDGLCMFCLCETGSDKSVYMDICDACNSKYTNEEINERVGKLP